MNNWISVKYRLPEISDGDHLGNILGFDNISKKCVIVRFDLFVHSKTRFNEWMPLPEPPK